MTSALAYLRTSSASNVDGDSAYRQNDAVMAFAKDKGLNVTVCYWDAAVSGADPIQTRAGFIDMLAYAKDHGCTTVIVENPTRFARDYLVQGNGLALMAAKGLTVLDASTGQDMTDTSDPMRKAMIAMMGVMAGLDKDMTVAKLKHGRDRVKALTGKCEGRKSHGEMNPTLIREAKRLARKNPKTGKVRSLREIAGELEVLGFTNAKGQRFHAQSVKELLAQG